ncbi:MAG: hypothetical protein ABIF19_10110 [Planctomycetota bacterium]
MNTQKRIEQCLRIAPKPPVPDNLLDKLQKDVAAGEAKTPCSALRRWFAPGGSRIVPRRIAAAAIIAIACLVPLSYGAAKIIKFVVEELTVMYGVDDENEKYITAYAFNPTVQGDCINNNEDAQQAEKEILQLIREGKAEEVSPGEYKAILSNGGEVIYDAGGIPIEILQSENRQEKIKELTDEIESLKKAGEFERTFLDVVKSPKGHDVYIYKTRYVLSNGVTITLNSGFPHKVEEKGKD